jgi:hypothetical protein
VELRTNSQLFLSLGDCLGDVDHVLRVHPDAAMPAHDLRAVLLGDVDQPVRRDFQLFLEEAVVDLAFDVLRVNPA